MIRQSRPELKTLAGLIRVCNFGDRSIPYASALKLQDRLFLDCKNGHGPDTVLQLQRTVEYEEFADGLQHPAVYTVGKRGNPHDFLKSTDQLTGLGAEIHTAPRGGETTFHGPGQLVMYPIVNLRRLRIGARAYVEGLEDTVIGALSQLGIQAQGRQANRTGVWVDDEKIAAIGVQISAGIARHGLALNVSTDLSYFSHIIPCGLPDFGVTSLQTLLGPTDLDLCSKLLRQNFIKHFRYTDVKSIEADELLGIDDVSSWYQKS